MFLQIIHVTPASQLFSHVGKEPFVELAEAVLLVELAVDLGVGEQAERIAAVFLHIRQNCI